jgi:hypothetical protein
MTMRRRFVPFTALAFALVASPATAGAGRDDDGTDVTQVAQSSDAADLRAWGTSGLTYCDAVVLSKHWRLSVSQSKVLVGRKIRSNNKPTLNAALKQARAGAWNSSSKRCEFDDTGFSYSDAEKLAKLWKTSVTDAKSRVERKASAGDSSVVRDLLKKK